MLQKSTNNRNKLFKILRHLIAKPHEVFIPKILKTSYLHLIHHEFYRKHLVYS